jgi:hypothetical protein
MTPAQTGMQRLAAATPPEPPADAIASDSASDSASGNVTASGSVSYDNRWKQTGVRVLVSVQDAFDAYAQKQHLKKGPAITALLQMLMDGEIDVKTVRARTRAFRDD